MVWYFTFETFMYQLDQRSPTRGPREGPIRPANISKNGDFKRNIGQIGLFSQKHWILTQKYSSFLVQPARPCIKSHAARETLWDPWLRPSSLALRGPGPSIKNLFLSSTDAWQVLTKWLTFFTPLTISLKKNVLLCSESFHFFLSFVAHFSKQQFLKTVLHSPKYEHGNLMLSKFISNVFKYLSYF